MLRGAAAVVVVIAVLASASGVMVTVIGGGAVMLNTSVSFAASSIGMAFTISPPSRTIHALPRSADQRTPSPTALFSSHAPMSASPKAAFS